MAGAEDGSICCENHGADVTVLRDGGKGFRQGGEQRFREGIARGWAIECQDHDLAGVFTQ
jgi:hypothetical protein